MRSLWMSSVTPRNAERVRHPAPDGRSRLQRVGYPATEGRSSSLLRVFKECRAGIRCGGRGGGRRGGGGYGGSREDVDILVEEEATMKN
uniref:Uncharacterized protein n=2 Tax=Brassica oleracea TaxID=3712 RepID=A0A0D3D5D6_BRAOL|nr:unnamed protein product [Brassica oleracea]